MLSKLLKNDLRKNMRWMWILFVATIVFAGFTRGCEELGKTITFFKILTIFFDSLFYALVANTIIHPFLRSFLNFTKSIYGDESYLTHTLPVTKNQILNSKFLTAFTEIILGFICVVFALLIRFASPTMFSTLKLLLSTMIIGEFSVILILAFFVILVIVEFLMFISIIYFSIILANKSREKKVLKSFLYTGVMSFLALTILAIVIMLVLLISGVNLTSTMLMLSNQEFISIILTGIIVYSLVILFFYYLSKKEFNKGVNVD